MFRCRKFEYKLKPFKVFAISFTLIFLCFVAYEVSYTRHLEEMKWQLKFALNSIMQPVKNIVIEKDLDLPEDEILENIANEQSNLPVHFWNRNKKNDMKYNATCAPMPNIFGLHFVNAFWQVLDTPTAEFHLYAAYFDNRRENSLGPAVRILGMVNLKQSDPPEFPETFCQIWFDDSKEPLLTKTFSKDYIWMGGWGDPKSGVFQPYLLTCVLPDNDNFDNLVPKSVSLVEHACHSATNLLKVHYEHYEKESDKENFAVCVRGLAELTDISIQLIEWVEWLKVIGMNQIFLYSFHVHPQLGKVFNYYAKEKFVSVTPMVLTGQDPNTPYMQYYFLQSSGYNYQFDLIAYNDCLLRNMYKYKYIIPLELNEILMPQGVDNVEQLFEDLPKDYAAYAVRKATFIEEFNDDEFHDVPGYLKFARNVYRTKDIAPKGLGIRCFFDTKQMLFIHNHYPLKALKDPMQIFDLEPANIYLEQHTEKCMETNCNDLKLFDTRKWYFKDKIIDNVEKVLRHLNYFKD